MSFVDVKLNSERFRRAVAKVPGLAEVQINRALTDIGNAFRSHMIETRMSGPPGLSAGDGEFRKSLGFHVGQGERGRQLRVGFYGPGGKPARLHEYGGVVTANGSHARCGKGLALAIPLKAAKTANLRSRMGPCEYGHYDPVKNPTGLVPIMSKKGNILLMAVVGGGKAVRRDPRTVTPGQARPRGSFSRAERRQMVPMFVLKRSVTFRPKLGFIRTWGEFKPRALARIDRAKEAVIAAAFGKGGA